MKNRGGRLKGGTENSLEKLPMKHHAGFTVWRKWCCQEIEPEVFAVLNVVRNCTEADGAVVSGDPASLVEFGNQKVKLPAPASRQALRRGRRGIQPTCP